jgi:hypothetical protein
MFIPPEFQLCEFDDGPSLPAPPARRWLSNWMAIEGTPADEVVLGWSPGTGTVVTVGTSERAQERELLRLVCAVQALGGGDLPVPAMPEPSGGAVHREIDRIVAAADLWRPLPPMLPAALEGEACELEGYAIGYCCLADGPAVTVASVGVPVDRFKVRPVQGWRAYNVNASEQHTLEELSRARQEHDDGIG